MRRMPIVCIAALLTAAACAGDESANAPVSPGPNDDIPCDVPNPGASPLTRLNSREYRNTLRGLFGITGDLGMPADNVPKGLGYDNSVANTSVSQLRVDAMYDNAGAVAEQLAIDLDAILPCDVAAVDDACIDAFIHTLGRRVYRRPLDTVESDLLRKVYDDALQRGDELQTRINLVLQAISFSPQFVYKAELGDSNAKQVAPGVTPLSDYEVATRLAFLFWGSAPDDALLDVAAAGGLSSREDVEKQAREMLDDPRAREGVVSFLMQWIEVGDLSLVARDVERYSQFDAALASSMEEELRRFFELVVFEGNGSVVDLLQAEQTVVDTSLAALYGVPHPTGEGWETVGLPQGERQGVLTLAGFLTQKAHAIQPAPVQRGLFVRSRLLCDTIPEPPDDVDISLPSAEESKATSNRELLSQHSQDPACASCHVKMDPIGFGLEHFDSIGQFRTMDNGVAVDASGEIVEAGDATGGFVGAIELSDLIAASERVRVCMRRQVFRYATGRTAEHADKCNLKQVESRDVKAEGSIRELLVGIASSDGFRFRQEGE